MSATIETAGLVAYAGQFEPKLITQLLLGITATQDITLDQNVKGKKNLTKLTTASIMRPYTPEFTATTSSLVYSGRSIVTEIGKGEILVDVMDYKRTWLEQQMAPGVPEAKLEAIPFAAQTWNQVMLGAGTDIDLNTIWAGEHNPNGTTAKDICDGLGTIIKREITGAKLVANVTGAITSADAVEQVEFMYKRHATKYRRIPMYAYMSYETYDKYCENYRERFKVRSTPDNFLQRAIEHSDGKCFLKPVQWMGASDRIMVTPKENLILATDRLSDLNKVRAVPDVWTVKAGIAIALGTQIRDLEVIQVNDVD